MEVYNFSIFIQQERKQKMFNNMPSLFKPPKQNQTSRFSQLKNSQQPSQPTENTQLNQQNATNSTRNSKMQSSSKLFSNLFKNSTIIKQQLLVSKFYQVITGVQKKFLPQIKIKPTFLMNKIQQSRPLFKNSVIYKELAYDIQLEYQINKPYKIKDCVSPARPNSQTYKRISKQYFENVKKGVDQCVLFTGLQNAARIQSSIGNQNNPGLFMIIAIAMLDEKYKENHQRFDVEFSFLEYKNQKMYDLINYTQVPLQPKYRQSNLSSHTKSNKYHTFLAPQFNQHRVKVCTFMQFIKIFKVALFNNKQRDFRTYKKTSTVQSSNLTYFNEQILSTFIMKIRIKKYNIENELIFQQQNVLIDFQENSSLRFKKQDQNKKVNKLIQSSTMTHTALSQNDNKQFQKQKNQINSRTLMDYLLIQINNSNPSNKQIHYHMVEKNLLLQMMKRYFRIKQVTSKDEERSFSKNNQFVNGSNTKNKFQKDNKSPSNILKNYLAKQQTKQVYVGGQLFIINSFTTNPYKYAENIKYYQKIINSLGQIWQANYNHKSNLNTFFDTIYLTKILDKVIYSLKHRKYESLRDLYIAKQFYLKQSKKIISSIKQYKNVLFQYTKLKRQFKYAQNLFTAYQLQLIGNCIKSDNFKDFYASKSFISLPRQIQIKTTNNKTEIINFIHGLKQVEQKYHLIKKKEKNNIKHSNEAPSFLKKSLGVAQNTKQQSKPASNQLTQNSNNKKFKILQPTQSQPIFQQFNDLQQFYSLRRYIYDYLHEVWHKIYLSDERTITEQILYQQFLNQEIMTLNSSFNQFIRQIQQIDDSNIKCTKDDKTLSINGFTQLIRSINQSKKSILKYQTKKTGHSPFKMKQLKLAQKNIKQNMYQTATHLPKINQNQNRSQVLLQINKNKSLSSNDKNAKNVQIFEINGKVNFENFLLNPKRLA